MNENTKNNYPLLNIKIQISDDDIANLIIMEEDVIEEKIKEFCLEHNLPDSAQGIITQQVMNQLEEQFTECNIIYIYFYSTKQC